MPPQGHPDRAALEAGQLDGLRVLLAELIPANRFYTRKLHHAGLGFDVASLADYAQRFPFTTKPELAADQASHPPFGTNLTYPLETYTRFHQTSGTTGRPMRWLDTPESWEAMLENWMEVYLEAGIRREDRVYFAFSFGPFIGFWMAFESAQRLGCLCLPGGGLGSRARLQAILDNAATALCCTPTYAIRLGEVAAEAGITLAGSGVRRIIVAGEPGGSIPATRKHIEQLWPGARVFDHHGMTEVGPVTFECPSEPGLLHVLERAFIAEIIEPGTGHPVPPGHAGELILTPLGRTASPLLRYRTGDLVQGRRQKAQAGRNGPAHEAPCACGRFELALEGGILGRVDDMVIVRGVNVYPSAVEGIVRSVGGVAEYQVCLTTRGSMTEMKLRVEPTRDCADPQSLPGQLRAAFENVLSLRVPIERVAPDSLPRFETKSKRWRRD
jgi:phenylacetate-CoA ligase